MNRCTTVKLHSSVRLLDKNQPMQLADFTIEAFEVPHDGTDNVGYCITIDNKTFSFLTDMGEITPMSASYIQRANYLVIEANYDHDMLMNGKYSNHLKARVSSRTGHMCNDDTAAFLASHYTDKLKNIWLCHLSRNNNKPELAYNAVEQALNNAGVVVGRDVQLRCLERTKPSELYLFE